VKPSIKNGIVEFIVQLDNATNESLRPNMKVEVFIITNRSLRTLRVANGPAFNGKRKQFIYVLKNGIAYRRDVEVGLSNFDYVEIKSGLAKGENVILTDMSQFENLEEITIK